MMAVESGERVHVTPANQVGNSFDSQLTQGLNNLAGSVAALNKNNSGEGSSAGTYPCTSSHG